MLSAVAVLPQPPLLLPELGGSATAETADLRAACLRAVRQLAAAAPQWVAVGAEAGDRADDGGRQTVTSDAVGTFIGFGVDVRVRLDTRPGAPDTGSRAADPDLALPLLVAGWAADAAGVAVTVRGELVAPDLPTDRCLALGAALGSELAGGPEPVGLLVVGDGAATHTEKAPGHLDERAKPFDDAVATALAHADIDALAALDPELAAQLWAVGRAPWQVLAGAARGHDWAAELLYSQAPYGVAYHVAVWTPV